ncbi:hypothetical protein HNR62_002029 [Oceanisphaera litoralis]|uniref:Sbal_3080 family lipoprotein n=1 Tax=Oceanisphaera litoralis TaxID=225144 RepID=UPI00195C3D8A|nr:Sbal_3080 family lipoprotein [Oceanisphaera litoralis]MBM7456148.1 hypothetical protein [Oceanisphaera litoralis]
MLRQLIPVLLLTMVLSGCSIQQSVETAKIENSATLCVVQNPEVRAGFLHSLESALADNGVRFRVVDRMTVPAECRWTANYNARWSWDLALYMSYAEIQIYKDGLRQGKALYDSTAGGANPGKFIDADTKIRELVSSLLSVKTASIFQRTYGYSSVI